MESWSSDSDPGDVGIIPTSRKWARIPGATGALTLPVAVKSGLSSDAGKTSHTAVTTKYRPIHASLEHD